MRKILFLLIGLFFIRPLNADALNWIDTDNAQLRADIQLLSAVGIITVPINTYPLPWVGIARDLQRIETLELSPSLHAAYLRVYQYWQLAKSGEKPFNLQASLASEAARFHHFGTPYRERAEFSAGMEQATSRYAVKLQGSLVDDPDDGKNSRLDGSYARARLGNWIFAVEAVDRWWGPGNDTGLIVAGNARPVPAFSISRYDHAPLETPWLSWIGPWNMTATWGQLESERAVPDANLFTMRVEMRPLSWLEVGMSRSAVMCGEGKPCDLDSFYNMFIGRTNVGRHGVTENNANQNGGVDYKLSGLLWDTPVALYGEMIGEDTSQSFPFFQAKSKLFGGELWLTRGQESVKLFVEYTDTYVTCGPKDTAIPNCMYEHSEYRSGYRYWGRSMGSTYDNDAYTVVLGAQGVNVDDEWSLNLSFLKLNKDGTDLQPPGGNSIAYQQAEDMLRLYGDYRFPLLSGWLTLGGELSHSELGPGAKEGENDRDAAVYGQYEWRF